MTMTGWIVLIALLSAAFGWFLGYVQGHAEGMECGQSDDDEEWDA